MSAPASIPCVGAIQSSLVVDSPSNCKFPIVSDFCLIVDLHFHPSRALTRSLEVFNPSTWMYFCDGSNNSGGVGVAQPNPNITQNPTQNNPEDAQTTETVPTEVGQFIESNSSTLDSDNVNLVLQILPSMVDDNNQPLPENIPTPAEEAQDAPQFFSTLEHSGDCYCCLAGGCKHKACLSLYTDVKPTIQQLFEMFFFKQYVEGIIIPQKNIHLRKEKHCPVSYGEFLHWLGLLFLMATINGPDCPNFWFMGEGDCFIGSPLR